MDFIYRTLPENRLSTSMFQFPPIDMFMGITWFLFISQPLISKSHLSPCEKFAYALSILSREPRSGTMVV